MDIGIFNLNIDEHSELLLKRFVYASSCKGGYNTYQLNTDTKNHGHIEKIIYKIAEHNISFIKNANIEDFNITFFTKNYKIENNSVNMHTDFDDFDFIKNDKQTINPVISSVTYLNKSTNPTMFTNITEDDMYDSNDINRADIDKNISSLLYYPDKNDHIVFEGGKYYHGEIPMENSKIPFSNTPIECKDNLCKERITLVVFIWNKDDLPIVPYFNDDFIAYNVIDKYWDHFQNTGILDSYIDDILNRKKEPTIQNNESKEIKMEINDKKVNIIHYIDNLLKYKFYKGIINNKIHNLHNFNNICDYDIVNKSTNNRNEISLQELNNIFLLSANNIDINNIFVFQTQYTNEYILDYKLFEQYMYNYTLDIIWKNKSIYECYPIYKMHNIEFQIDNSLIEQNICNYISNKQDIYGSSQFLLDTKKKMFSPLEKLVYDIADNSLKNINIPFNNDVVVEFWIKTEHDDNKITFHIDSTDTEYLDGYNVHPFLSNICFLNDISNNNYTVVSDFNMNDLKYNNYKDKDICFIRPRQNKLLTIFGGKHYHGNIKCTDEKRHLLILNYWRKSQEYYHSYYDNTYNDQLYEKTQCVANISTSRNYKTIQIDSELIDRTNKNLLEVKDNEENFTELISKIDDTYDATLFTSNKRVNTLKCIKFDTDIDKNKDYIENEFNRLNKEVSVSHTKLPQNNVNKTTDHIFKKSSIVKKENFDIYNYYISFHILSITEEYIKSLNNNFIIFNDRIKCLELDYRTDFDDDIQKFIFKILILPVLDNLKKTNIDIQTLKIRKNIIYNDVIDNNCIYIPLSDNSKIQIGSHKIDVLKGGFVDVKKNTHIHINNEEIILYIEYI